MDDVRLLRDVIEQFLGGRGGEEIRISNVPTSALELSKACVQLLLGSERVLLSLVILVN